MSWFQGQRFDTDASASDVERVLTRAPHTAPRSSASMVPGAMALVGPKTRFAWIAEVPNTDEGLVHEGADA